MDPLCSETCWSNFKYFIIILFVSTNYIFVHLLDIEVSSLMHGTNMKIQMLFSAVRLRNTKSVIVFTLCVACLRVFNAHLNKFKFHSSDELFEL